MLRSILPRSWVSGMCVCFWHQSCAPSTSRLSSQDTPAFVASQRHNHCAPCVGIVIRGNAVLLEPAHGDPWPRSHRLIDPLKHTKNQHQNPTPGTERRYLVAVIAAGALVYAWVTRSADPSPPWLQRGIKPMEVCSRRCPLPHFLLAACGLTPTIRNPSTRLCQLGMQWLHALSLFNVRSAVQELVTPTNSPSRARAHTNSRPLGGVPRGSSGG